ncbi:MAG: hypothetical protein IJ428_05155 [Clostridia bacterium]|nr:hypothetical protein [Clostridia bacterium]
MKKRFISLFLLTALLLGTIGCDSQSDTNDDTTADTTPSVSDTEPVEVEELDFTEARKAVKDGLDEYENKFEGKEYRVAVSEANHKYVIVEDTSDVVDKAVYDRNMAVEERFGCKIVLAHTSERWSTAEGYIRTSVMSQEDLFDIASHHAVSLGNLVLQDYFMNWYDIPAVDFTKPWWSDSTVDTLTYDNTCLVAVGDFALTALSNAYCVYYNKADAEVYKLPDLYEVVNEGKWTIDYMLELTKDIYEDSNRNDTVDNEDYFGYISDAGTNIVAYLWAFDNQILDVSGDNIELVYKTEKINDIVTKLVDATSSGAIRIDSKYISSNGTKHNYGIELFAKGQALFSNGYITQALTFLRDMEDDYGILPYPKWDEEQDEYLTMSDGNHTALAVPRTVPDENLEFVGVITEALCAESYKTLLPAYYEEALKLKGTRDDESLAMIDNITRSVVYDMGYIHNGASVANILENLVIQGNPNFESYWASMSSKINEYYNGVIAYYQNYN